MPGKRRSGSATAMLVIGAAFLVAAVVIGLVTGSMAALFLGVCGVICVLIVIGAPLRRSGSPQGAYRRLIAAGVALMVLAGAAETLPPHSALVATLILLAGVGAFVIGIAILGGGTFGIIACVAAGLLGSTLMLAPSALLLPAVGVPQQCRVASGEEQDVYDFTAVCPGGHRYHFSNDHAKDFPGARVTVLVDPHGVLQAEYVGEHQPAIDLPVTILSVLTAAGVVVAAAVNRRRKAGAVDPVVKPPITT